MNRVIIEILEMKGCPECHVMKKVLNDALSDIEHLRDKIEVVFLDLFEDNNRINELGMYRCPALAINGVIYFMGEIPGKEELKSIIISEIVSR
ncbi:MAG: thioredoxin family protein [Persephonella sp.]|nr:thioredoxin family protein [Persephonella sp.]